MANKVLTFVWEHSKQKGSALLMLVAMADQANDHGVCFPATDTLAERCRVSRRQAQRLVDQLEASGEIVIYNRQDPEHKQHFYSNVYVIKMPGVKPVLPEPGVYSKRLSAPDSDAGVTTSCSHKPNRTMRNSDTHDTTVVTPTSLHSDTHDIEIVTRASLDPLFNPTDNHQDNQKQQIAATPAPAPAREAAAAAPDPIPVISVVSKPDDAPPTANNPPPGSAPPSPQPAEPERPNIFKLHEDLTGSLSGLIVDELKEAEREYPADWIEEAFTEAARCNRRSWAYVHGILKRYRRDGFTPPIRETSNGSTPRPSPAPAPRASSPGAPNARPVPRAEPLSEPEKTA